MSENGHIEDDLPVVSTGNAGLDGILGGGFDPRRMYPVEGQPGSGKTTLALQWQRHPAGNPGPSLRAVLHDKGEGQGYRARPRHGLRLPQTVWGPRQNLQ